VSRVGSHAFLVFYSGIVLVPILLIVMNAFKSKSALFNDPLGLPIGDAFSLYGFNTVMASGDVPIHFYNSLVVTAGSLALALVAGSLAAYALGALPFRGSRALELFLIVGIMIPIRLGTVRILTMMVSLHLVNTLAALIIVYTAQSLPLVIFVLTQFFREIPHDMMDAARVDGASEYRVYRLVLPLVTPAMATAAALIMIPVWNDLWWPLILAPATSTQTVTLWAQQFLGQYQNDWNATITALTMTAVPVLLFYTLISRQLIRGLMSGSIK
jgi:raffinose/stachyose/melibiose transport system permease protein